MDWFLYDIGLRHEKVNEKNHYVDFQVNKPFQMKK